MAEARKDRDATYDIARGVGMMLVIYGHLIEVIFPTEPGKPFIESAFLQWQVIYSFHMPLFFLVSGSVNQKLPGRSFGDALQGTLRIWAMAWLAHLAGAVVWFALNYQEAAGRSLYANIWEVVGPLLRGESFYIGVLWFLMSLGAVQLLAWLCLRFTIPVIVPVLAIAGSFAVTYFFPQMPNYFLMRTWLPGLAFFSLGFFLAKWRYAPWTWLYIPLLAAVIYLAQLNKGCSFTLADACPNVAGRFGIWNFAGRYGFLPLFYLTALLGSVAILSFSKGAAGYRASGILAYIGKNSFDLFIINGFVAVFISPLLSKIPFPDYQALYVSIPYYVGLAIAVTAVHLLAMRLLRPALGLLHSGSSAIAAFLTQPLRKTA